MAEFQGLRVARAIAAELGVGEPPAPFDGTGYCPVEVGANCGSDGSRELVRRAGSGGRDRRAERRLCGREGCLRDDPARSLVRPLDASLDLGRAAGRDVERPHRDRHRAPRPRGRRRRSSAVVRRRARARRRSRPVVAHGPGRDRSRPARRPRLCVRASAASRTVHSRPDRIETSQPLSAKRGHRIDVRSAEPHLEMDVRAGGVAGRCRRARAAGRCARGRRRGRRRARDARRASARRRRGRP